MYLSLIWNISESGGYLRFICCQQQQCFIALYSLFNWSWEYHHFFLKNLGQFLFIMLFVMHFLQDSCCLSTIFLSRHRHDIPEFCLFTQSRVVHVTLTNPQTIRLEFHLWSLPQLAIVLVAMCLLLQRADETQPGWNSCLRLHLASLDSIMSLSRLIFYLVSALLDF